MNWKAIMTASALSILPLSVNAAEFYPTNQNQVTESMGHQTHFAKRGRKGDCGQKMERLLQELDLTTQQSAQIDTIKERSQTAMEELKEQLQAQREEIQSLLANDAAVNDIREEHQVAQSLHQQLDSNRFETMLEIREVLTDEQKAKMAELLESQRDRKAR